MDIFPFLSARGVTSPEIHKMKADKIDGTIVHLLTDDELARYLVSFGDRVALRHFCRQESAPSKSSSSETHFPKKRPFQRSRTRSGSGSRSPELSPNYRSPPRNKRRHGQLNNKNAEKEKRTMTLGLKIVDVSSGVKKQIYATKGGGVHKVYVSKRLRLPELIRLGSALFFPSGVSSHFGNVSDYECDIEDNQDISIGKHTVEEVYDRLHSQQLKMYFVCRPKCIRQDSRSTHPSRVVDGEKFDDFSPSHLGKVSDYGCDVGDDRDISIGEHIVQEIYDGMKTYFVYQPQGICRDNRSTHLSCVVESEKSDDSSTAHFGKVLDYGCDAGDSRDISIGEHTVQKIYDGIKSQQMKTYLVCKPKGICRDDPSAHLSCVVDGEMSDDSSPATSTSEHSSSSPGSETSSVFRTSELALSDDETLDDSTEEFTSDTECNAGDDVRPSDECLTIDFPRRASEVTNGDASNVSRPIVDASEVILVGDLRAELGNEIVVVSSLGSGHSLTEAHVVLVQNANVFNDLLEAFNDDGVMFNIADVQIQRILPDGNLEKANDGGNVTMNVLMAFWSVFYEKCTRGNVLKVPVVRHGFREKWANIARIIAFGWRAVRYLPLKLPKVIFEFCLWDSVHDENLLPALLDTVTPEEKGVLTRALNDASRADLVDVAEVLYHLNCNTPINSENLKEVLKDVAHVELFQKPKFVYDCWRVILKNWLHISPAELTAAYNQLMQSCH